MRSFFEACISSILSIASKGCSISCKKKKRALAVVYIVFGILSLILDLLVKKGWIILLAELPLSAIVGTAVIFAYINDKSIAAETRPLSDRKLGAVEITFSVVQFSDTLSIFIVRVMDIKKIGFALSSLYPLSFSIIGFTYIFKDDVSSSEDFPRDNKVDLEDARALGDDAPLLGGSAPSVRFQYKGCGISRKYKKLAQGVVFLLLEFISLILDLLGNEGWVFNLAAFLFSLFVCIAVACTCIIDRCAGETKPQSERQFGAAEVTFSVFQLFASIFPFIERVLDIKVDYTFSALCPFLFSIIILFYKSKDDATSETDIARNMPRRPIHPPLCGDYVIDIGRSAPTDDEMISTMNREDYISGNQLRRRKTHGEGNFISNIIQRLMMRLLRNLKWSQDGNVADDMQADPFQLMTYEDATVTATVKAEPYSDQLQKVVKDLFATLFTIIEAEVCLDQLRKNIKDLVAITAKMQGVLSLDQLLKNIKNLEVNVTDNLEAVLSLDRLRKNVIHLEGNVTDNVQVVQSLDRLLKNIIQLFTICKKLGDMQAIVPVQPLVDRFEKWRRGVLCTLQPMFEHHILIELKDKLGITSPIAKENRLSRSKGSARAPKTRFNEPKLASAGRPWKTPKIGPKRMKSR